MHSAVFQASGYVNTQTWSASSPWRRQTIKDVVADGEGNDGGESGVPKEVRPREYSVQEATSHQVQPTFLVLFALRTY